MLNMELVEKIKQKKELKGLSNEIVLSALNKYLLKNKISISNLREKEEKVIIKEIRSELRNLTGQFQKSSRDRISLLKEKSLNSLLKTHSSTEERLDFYPELKSIIGSLKPNSILDLGCGINPIALASKNVEYFASDIKEDELSLIKEYFKENKIKGKTFIYDLRLFDPKDFPKTDLTIIFKVLDVIEKKSHFLTEKIILGIKSKNILVSFATKKLSGKPMNFPQRRWFIKILEKHGLKYKTFSYKNEIFYLIHKI